MESSESAWHSFPILHPKLIDSLISIGFKTPTDIQAQTLLNYPHHNDFIIASMTV